MNHTNKQDQRPAFQFYPKDWLSDTGLRCCSPAARGLWMDMLCIMWSSPVRGALLTPANLQIACKSLQNLTCISLANDVQKYLDELEAHGVLSRLDDGTIINRRMYFQAQRENDISEKRRIAACKSHASRVRKSRAKPAAPSPTAFATATPKEKDIRSWFDELWQVYPRDKNGVRQGKKLAWKYFQASVRSETDFVSIKAALKSYCASEAVSKGFVKNGSTWFNNWKDWEDVKANKTTNKDWDCGNFDK